MRQTLRCLPLLATSISVIALTACGGGGGGGDDVTPIPSTQFPLSTVAENIAKEKKTYQFRISESVTDAGNSFRFNGSGTHTITSGLASFEGASAIKQTATSKGSGSIDGKNSSIGFDDSVSSYYGANYKPVGYVDSDTYCLVSNLLELPASAAVGQSGSWYDMTCYASSLKSTKVGAVSVNYALESDSMESAALLKITSQATGVQGQSRKTLVTYRITTGGASTLLSEVTVFSDATSKVTTEKTYQ